MAKFRIDSIGTLADQMAFTPQAARAEQLANAEHLLHTLHPAKAYPLDFIIYRVTGYHPRKVDSALLTGMALQHDLGMLIEHVSETLDIHTAALNEPVMSIDEVTERFNVTSKTIQRWRRRGLPARRFVFPDGRRRVGFLLSSVERFFATHRQATRGTNLSVVEADEKQQILRRAVRLIESRCGITQITRRIGRKLNRSPAAILQVLRQHDVEHPDDALLSRVASPVCEEVRACVLRAVDNGTRLTAISKRMHLPRTMLHRIVLDEQLERITRREVRFIDDELYHHDDARQVMESLVRQEELPATSVPAESTRTPRDVPPYLLELYRVPLLTPSRERALFLKFNFHKFQFVTARRKLEPELAGVRHLKRLNEFLSKATEVKNEIVRANLRLVVNIARKHVRSGVSLMELISEGNLTLMRAVESFDVHKGYRFSTYATLALMKGFARSVPQMLEQNRQSSGQPDRVAELPDLRSAVHSDRIINREHVRELLSQLDERERAVLQALYGLTGSTDASASTQGLSTQRLRQIERTAIEKLRSLR